MQFIVPDEQVKTQWNTLVKSANGAVFSTSDYLDATGFSWKLLVNESFTAGMACPYVDKFGQAFLVTPFFVRYVEWIGVKEDESLILSTLKKEFSVADLQVRNSFLNAEKKQYQYLNPGSLELGSQAKRSLKKAAGLVVTWELRIPDLKQLVEAELSGKIAGIDEGTVQLLEQIVKKMGAEIVCQVNCLDFDSNFCGGLWLLEYGDRVIYLKGTTTPEAKKNGAMYRLMLEAIEMTHAKGKIFDFGGSNVENVRRFNLNFGAKDENYFRLSWNHAPWWWNMLRNWKKAWRKK